MRSYLKYYMKKISMFFIIILLILNFSSCNKYEDYDDVIKVGINLELSGSLSQYGENCLEGIKIATDKINNNGGLNGKKIKLVVLDNASQTSLAGLTALKFQEKEKVLAIIGPSTSSLFKATTQQNVSLAMITPGATSDNLSNNNCNNIIRACYKDSVQGEILAQKAYKMGFKNISFLTDLSSDYSCGISKSFKRTFENLGGKIIQEKFFNSSDVDFSSVITSYDLKNTDAFFIPAYYDQGGIIVKQMRKLGVNKPIFSGDSFDSPALNEITGNDRFLENVFFTNHACFDEKGEQGSEKEYFKKEYIKRYGRLPAAYCALGYDSLMIFEKGYEIASKKYDDITPENLLSSIKLIKDETFATGKISINENGDAIKNPVFVTINDGKQKTIK